jgi:hypothetical protein
MSFFSRVKSTARKSAGSLGQFFSGAGRGVDTALRFIEPIAKLNPELNLAYTVAKPATELLKQGFGLGQNLSRIAERALM